MTEQHALTQHFSAEPAMTDAQTAVSEFEQQVWLHHQQSGDSCHQFLSAFRLNGDINLSLLMQSLVAVLQSLPHLDARYLLNDAFELVKQQHASQHLAIDMVQVSDVREASQHMLHWQSQRMDLAQEAPLQCRLYLSAQGEVLLAVRHHRILAQGIHWQTIFSSLSSFYHGELNVQAWAESGYSGSPVAHPLFQADQPLSNEHAWLGAGRQSGRRAIEQLGVEPLETEIRQAEKVRVSLPLSRLSRLTDHQGPQASFDPARPDPENLARATTSPGTLDDGTFEHETMLFAAIATFAGFLSRLSGQSQQMMYAPKQVSQRHHELNGSTVQSDLVRIALDLADKTEQELLAEVESQCRSGCSFPLATPQRDELSTLVTWSVDPAVHLRLRQVQCETLRLPPIHSDFDLILALGIRCDNELLLELTTGARLSPYIGSWLLDQFSQSLGSGLPQGERFGPKAQPEKPVDGQQAGDSAAAERNWLAGLIADAFGAALGVEEFGIHDDFFDFGGHSLIATRVIGKLKTEHLIEIHINDLFSQPTAWGLAAHATSHQSEPRVKQNEVTETLAAPLAFAQDSLWKAYAAFGYNELFNIPFALRFVDPVDEVVFEQAFRDLMLRHSVLRSLFTTQDGQVMQRVVSEAELAQYRWFWYSQDTGPVDRQAMLNQEASHVFDLAKELPLRLRFMTDPDSGVQYLSFLFHHVVLDEWSVNLLMDDLCTAYASRAAGRAPEWPDAPPAFCDFAAKQHEAGFDASHLDYWVSQFTGVPLDIPLLPALQNPSPSESSDAGGWVETKLDPETVHGLYQLARQQGASLFNVIYAAIALGLKQLGAPDKLVVGTPASGRLDAAYFDTVGYFTTLAMHVVHFDQADTVAALVAQVKNTINESLDYSDVPIDWVEEALLGNEAPKGHLFEVMIQLHAKNKLHGELTTAQQSIRFEQVDPEKSDSALGLQFEVMEENIGGEDTIRVLMSYRSAQYGESQVKQLTQTMRSMLAQFARPASAALALSHVIQGGGHL